MKSIRHLRTEEIPSIYKSISLCCIRFGLFFKLPLVLTTDECLDDVNNPH